MTHKKLAAIDIGTNTFRLLIAEVDYDSRRDTFTLKELYSERTITRLGEGLHNSRMLQESSMKRSIDTLVSYAGILRKYSIEKVSAVATSALRMAQNESDFLERVKNSTGIDIQVISGEEEAARTAAGMLLEMEPPESALLIDIGGGSTELVLIENKKPVKAHSLDLGVVYLAGKYMTENPPLKQDIMSMDKEIDHAAGHFQSLFADRISNHTLMIGTAGTITTLSAVIQNLNRFDHASIHNSILEVNDINKIFGDISSVSSEVRAQYIPFEPERLDIIVPGTLILLKLMETFKFRTLTVSDYGLREGILIDLYRSLTTTE